MKKHLTDLNTNDQNYCRDLLWGASDFGLFRQLRLRLLGFPSKTNKIIAESFLVSEGFTPIDAHQVIDHMSEQGPPQKYIKIKLDN